MLAIAGVRCVKSVAAVCNAISDRMVGPSALTPTSHFSVIHPVGVFEQEIFGEGRCGIDWSAEICQMVSLSGGQGRWDLEERSAFR